MKSYVAIFFVALSFISSALCQCSPPFISADEYCFYVSAENDAVSWFQAKINCIQEVGGQIAVIDSIAKTDSINGLLGIAAPGYNVWIGAMSVGLSSYVWDPTGLPVEYNNWGTSVDNTEECSYIDAFDHYWYPGPYESLYRYVCEPASCST